MAQSHHDYSRIAQEGIGEHDLSILDVPSHDWSTIFRPWNIPALFLDVTHGFAARWWLMALILFLGAYLLLLEFTDRTDAAVLFSLGIGLSPFFSWWYASSSLDSAGLGMLALASFLYSVRAPTTLRRMAWLGLAAYATIGFVLVLYPPFLIPVGLVMAMIGACELVGRRFELGLTWRRIGTDFGLVIFVVGLVLAAYYLHARGALTADNNTIYPGHRRVGGAHGSTLQLLSAPFGLSLAVHGAGITSTNQSEISSFLFLGPFALLQLFRMRLRDLTFRWRVLLMGTSAIFLLLLTWYLISLPPIVSSLLFLDRVPAVRSIAGVGIAGILLMVFLCVAEFKPTEADDSSSARATRTIRERRWRINSGAIVCASLAFGLYFYVGRSFVSTFPTLHLSLLEAGLAAAGAAVVVLFTSARKVIGGGMAFVLFGAVVSVPINPLYHGLGTLTASPLTKSFTQSASSPRDPGHHVWLSYEGPAVTDVLIASGLQTLNAIDLYPDRNTWRVLDPHQRSVNVWNRYANLLFVPGTQATPELKLLAPDLISIAIDPCSPIAGKLGIGFVVSPSPQSNPCLVLESHSTYPAGSLYPASPVYIYARTATRNN